MIFTKDEIDANPVINEPLSCRLRRVGKQTNAQKNYHLTKTSWSGNYLSHCVTGQASVANGLLY